MLGGEVGLLRPRRPDFFDPADFARIPTVFLGRDPRTLPAWASYVNPSPKGPGARAAMELLKAGLQSFAFIASSGNHFWSRDREAEFRSILHLHGLDCAVFGRKESFRSEKARGKACAAFLKGLPKPCGVMAENDYQAVYVLDLARRMRIAVPSQIPRATHANRRAVADGRDRRRRRHLPLRERPSRAL